MECKLRAINGGLVLTIPKKICDLYRLRNGDILTIEPIGKEALRIKKVFSDSLVSKKLVGLRG